MCRTLQTFLLIKMTRGSSKSLPVSIHSTRMKIEERIYLCRSVQNSAKFGKYEKILSNTPGRRTSLFNATFFSSPPSLDSSHLQKESISVLSSPPPPPSPLLLLFQEERQADRWRRCCSLPWRGRDRNPAVRSDFLEDSVFSMPPPPPPHSSSGIGGGRETRGKFRVLRQEQAIGSKQD